MKNTTPQIAQTFTYIATSIEGEDFDIEQAGKTHPNFVRAYIKISNLDRDKAREIANAVEAAFPTDFSSVDAMFAARDDQQARDDFQSQLEVLAKAEGFDGGMTQGWPNYVHVTATPVGRITRKTITSDVVFNAMHDGVGVSREEITVEIFGDENTPFPVMQVDPRGKIGGISITRIVGIASEKSDGDDDDDDVFFAPIKRYAYDMIAVYQNSHSGRETELGRFDNRFYCVENFGEEALKEKFEQIRLDQEPLWLGVSNHAGGTVLTMSCYHAETLASDYPEQFSAMLASPFLTGHENAERVLSALETIRNA